MAVSIEDILLAKVAADQANTPSTGAAAGAGAALGAGIGALAGNDVHNLGKALNGLKDRLAADRGMTRTRGQNVRSALRPGNRMAGGLVGMILGGALGAGTRQLMVQESPAAAMLAKVQTQDSLSHAEVQALQNVLGDAYNQTLAM